MQDFEILITSPPDRLKLVAEIWYKEQLVAELNQEKDKLELELYIKDNVTFNYELFCQILKDAKKKLLNE